ncbi:MAG: hypothetical protein ACRDHP_00200, partial [Ktedonobacterales bacterium]
TSTDTGELPPSEEVLDNSAEGATAAPAREDAPTSDVTMAVPATEAPLAAAEPAPRRGPVLLRRRNLLIAGGVGIVTLGAAGLIAKNEHLGYFIRTKIAHAKTPWIPPRPHPQPLPDGPLTTPSDLVIFDGKLATGWQDRSWGAHLAGDTSVTYQGQPVITGQIKNWSGLAFNTSLFDTSGMGYIQCFVRGEGKGGQFVTVYVNEGASVWRGGLLLGDYTKGGSISSSEWRMARVPLTALKADNLNAEGIVMQADGPNDQGMIHLADLRIVYHPDLNPPKVEKLWAYDLETITLAFQFEMDVNAAGRETAYMISSANSTKDPAYPASQPVTPLRARYHPLARTVSLLVPTPLRQGGTYAVSVAPIPDRFGVNTVKGSQGQVQVTSNPLALNFVPSAERKPINPEIYGMSIVSDHDLARDAGVTIARWGGTPQSRYNWKLGNAFNAGRDYYFQNGNYGRTSPADIAPSGVPDQQVQQDKAYGMSSLIQIPTTGWVANGSSPVRSIGVPGLGGIPSVPNGDAVPWYDPSSNRNLTSVPSRARKGSAFSDPPDLGDATVAQDEW